MWTKRNSLGTKTSVFVLLVTGLFFFAAPATAEVKVFLLGGQSNMQGMGGFPGATYGTTYYPPDDPCPPPYNAVQTTVKFWDYGTPSGGINVPETVGTHWVDLQPGFGWYPSEFGPEVSFGYSLRQNFPNDEIYLVKYAKGSTTLATDWRPNGTGVCYNWLKTRANAAIANLIGSGKSPVVAGMIWMQGEGDAKTTADANAYATNLTNFIDQVRDDFDTLDMPFVLGRIDDYYLSRVGGATVRAAQAAVANADENAAWFSTDNLENAYIGHFGTEGQIDLGNYFAYFMDELIPPIPGDASGNGVVDEEDAAILAANWGGAGGWEDGDFNNDGVVGAADAAILTANWHYGVPGESGTSVPEPSTLVLAATALLGLAGHRWRKRRWARDGSSPCPETSQTAAAKDLGVAKR